MVKCFFLQVCAVHDQENSLSREGILSVNVNVICCSCIPLYESKAVQTVQI